MYVRRETVVSYHFILNSHVHHNAGRSLLFEVLMKSRLTRVRARVLVFLDRDDEAAAFVTSSSAMSAPVANSSLAQGRWTHVFAAVTSRVRENKQRL